MQYKRIIIIGIMLCSALAGYFFFTKIGKRSFIADSDSFVVGTAAGYAPFVSINQYSEYEGFDIDVANALADRLGKKLILKDLGTMPALMMALDQASVDAVIWGLSITQERLKKFDMVHYQGTITDSYPLVFWNAIPDGVRNLSDMSGRTISVEPSSCQSTFLEKYKDIVILPVEKVDDALLNIQYGKVDAALLDPVIAKKFKNKFSEIKMLDIPLLPEDQVQGMGIAFKQNSKKLVSQVQHIIQDLKREGILALFEKKWGLE